MDKQFASKKIALYGLGTETERFISEHGDELDIVCLLDGYRTDGQEFGYPIMPIDAAISAGVEHIIVIARPGSCKAITRRIREICVGNDVTLFDVRGNDLLAENKVKFDYKEIKEKGESELRKAIDEAEVVSFDLFDTLIMRKYLSYTDVFEVLEHWPIAQGIEIEDFARKRLHAEKELSKGGSPRLVGIYEKVLGESKQIKAVDLASLEWELDSKSFMVRKKMVEILQYAVDAGKDVYITSDCYYSKEQLSYILVELGIGGYKDILVSCEYDVYKNQGLYDVLKERVGERKILHIGDDEYADIEMAKAAGISSFKILNAKEYLEYLGGLGTEEYATNLSERVKLGMVISKLFENPFAFEEPECRLLVDGAEDVGYIFCGAMIADFVLWMRNKVRESGLSQVLLCARDGYLLKRLYEYLEEGDKYKYFLTSRTAAIRAGIRDKGDIEYVDSMKFFGTKEQEMLSRYGIELESSGNKDACGDKCDSRDRDEVILAKAREQKLNYQKYCEANGISLTDDSALFDFVAKGTTQYFLKNIFTGKLKGFYFLQLEPEFMANRGIDIVPFYTEAERDTSKIFDSYYIMETILTAPTSSVLEFNEDGKPVFADETRSQADIACVLDAQKGIESFFEDYMDLVGEGQGFGIHETSKGLDETLLGLISHVHIADQRFTSLVVEDPFFGRMTDIKDVL